MILRVRNLRTYFYTYDGVVKALDGVSFAIRQGETLGLVGETGCGKSVTAFSVVKLISDPPGRIMSGEIRFRDVNLLFGLEHEAKFKPVRHTNRVKVRRSFGRVRLSQERMAAVRGGGISMIFQEPTAALNPIMAVWDQITEALLLHRGPEVIDGILGAHPAAPEAAAEIDACAEVARDRNPERLRAACRRLGEAVNLPSFATQAFHRLRGGLGDAEANAADLRGALRHRRPSGLQRAFLRRERRVMELRRDLRSIYLAEMREERPMAVRRRAAQFRILALRLRTFYFGLWGIRSYVRRPLRDETFWRTVRLLESVSIANPVNVARGYPHELSGGMIQRVMIAMALSADPALLIADEPTTALDVTIQAQILELMRDLKQRVGSSILLITHDMGVIAEVVDRVCVMYAGVVIEIAPVRDLFRRPLHPYTQGLLNSIPRMDDPGKRLESIPGSVPNLINPPTGCRFHPRCPHAMPICKEQRPPMTVEGEDHVVACYLYHGPEDRA